jgi:hypothetical protein
MDALVNFFTFRPVFTFLGLKIVWYVYLAHTFLQLYISFSELSQLLAKRGMSFSAWSPNSIVAILGIIVQIVIVRLLLEVAATILLSPKRSTP